MKFLPKPTIIAYFEELLRSPFHFLQVLPRIALLTLLSLVILYVFASFTILPQAIATLTGAKNQQKEIPRISQKQIPVALNNKTTTLPPVSPTDKQGYAPVVIPTALPTGIPTALPTGIPTAIPTLAPTKEPSLVPVEIRIPKIQIKTVVEHVGQTKKLNMDVPKNAAHVAWYVYGAKPGEQGNAVINGHYDTPTGAPAVFYRLRELEKGDTIIITSEDGRETTFVVTGKEKHPYKTFPNEYVFFTKPGKNVNLITCEGIWDTKNAIYNDRLVIYSTLKEN